MNESYAEYLVRRKTPAYAWLVTGLLGVITAFFVFMAMTAGVLSVILMFVFGFLTYLSYRNFHVEFEYLYGSHLPFQVTGIVGCIDDHG